MRVALDSDGLALMQLGREKLARGNDGVARVDSRSDGRSCELHSGDKG